MELPRGSPPSTSIILSSQSSEPRSGDNFRDKARARFRATPIYSSDVGRCPPRGECARAKAGAPATVDATFEVVLHEWYERRRFISVGRMVLV